MGSHTTYFCDHCNQDRDSTYDGGEAAVTYSEYPVGDGWAEFESPYIDNGGYDRTHPVYICSHCLADPEFEPKSRWAISKWDEGSRENFDKGRKHAEAFAWAQENLGSWERWHWRGARQVFGELGALVGPKLADDSWRVVKFDWEIESEAREAARVAAREAEEASV